MVDEATVKKLQTLLKEKEKELYEDNRIRMKNDNAIHDLRDAI